MLVSYVASIDQFGLRSLRPEMSSGRREGDVRQRATPVWAVLDSAHVPAVHKAMVDGDRQRALQLLTESARFWGSYSG